MAKKKIKLTRPELRHQRDALERYERYLPMLKLKQQQLQLTLRDLNRELLAARSEFDRSRRRFEQYRPVTRDKAGVNVEKLAEPAEVNTTRTNVAGVNVPQFRGVNFSQARYSLFGTPPWVDQALADLRELNEHKVRCETLGEARRLLNMELTRIIQRVNLFEKVMIPQCRENIRRIRIHLGDEMTAAVGRSKIAKSKLQARKAAAWQPAAQET